MKGLEPSRIAAPDPKSGVSANFTTSASQTKIKSPSFWGLNPKKLRRICKNAEFSKNSNSPSKIRNFLQNNHEFYLKILKNSQNSSEFL